MKINEFVNNVTRAANRFGLQCKKHAPEALVIGGVVGVVASAVMACKATTKVGEIIDKKNEQLDAINAAGERLQAGEELVCEDGSNYTMESYKKDILITYGQTAFEFVKLYGPSIALGALSLTAIVASHGILNKRNAALATAYTAVSAGFKDYRKQVVDRFGEELDKELRYDIRKEEVTETVTNEDGTESTVTKTVNVPHGPAINNEYAMCFDETCYGYRKNAEYNKQFLLRQQDWANEKLRANGHLFLNEVYDMLGRDRTKAGSIVGWIYDEKDPLRDNYVDFGIFDIDKAPNREFVNGIERAIWLDFNVDGVIYDLIG